MAELDAPISEEDVKARLWSLQDTFRPARLQRATPLTDERTAGVDAFVVVDWGDQDYQFAAELKSRWTPKTIQAAIEQAKRGAAATELLPMVVVPFLSEESLQLLEEAVVSGVDLCGNGLLLVPGRMLIRKSGAPNQFKGDSRIQNVYRGVSSLVARALLLKPQFDSTRELLAELRSRGADVTLPTVSKVCASLAEDLIIEREQRRQSKVVRLLQPDKLLDRLTVNYVPPTIRGSVSAGSKLPTDQLLDRLRDWKAARGERIVRTGADSTERYAVMAREPVRRFYCTNLRSLREYLAGDITENAPFPNVELLETRDPAVYFDPREKLIASPIQCYLELQGGDKRDQQAAVEVRRVCLASIGRNE